MLTPLFELKQDGEFVVISAKCPYIKASEIEVHVDDHDFKLYAKPYFLSLHLPGAVLEDDRAKAHYNVDTAQIVVTLPKKTPGEFFEDLGMLTKLLTPVKASGAGVSQAATKSLIEVIGGQDGGQRGDEQEVGEGRGEEEEEEEEEVEGEEEWDWRVEQTIPEEDTEDLLLSSVVQYGFANRYSNVFQKLQGEIPDLVDVPDPDHTPPRERHLARLANEDESFNADHYLADMMDNDYIQHVLLPYQPPWYKEMREWEEQQREREGQTTSCAASGDRSGWDPKEKQFPFSPDQRYQLKNLPRREYLLDKEEEHTLYLGLVDIVFAYAYNHRTTEGDNTVESAWTICKLSSTMSWLEVGLEQQSCAYTRVRFTGSLQEVVLSSIRRSLTFPLYRQWQLSLAVLEDTRTLFRLGRHRLLQCLLEVHQLLASSDPFYVFNDLYITDYCVWLQSASAKRVCSLAKQLDKVIVTKEEVGWDLNELEEAAHLVAMEEGMGDTEDSRDDTLLQESRAVTHPEEDRVLTHPEEGGAVTLPEEGRAVTLPEEGGAVTLPEEGGAVTLPEEGGAVTLPEEGGAVTHSEEGEAITLPEEGGVVTLSEEGGGADVYHEEQSGVDLPTVTRSVFGSCLYRVTASTLDSDLHPNRVPESLSSFLVQSKFNRNCDSPLPCRVNAECSTGELLAQLSHTSESDVTTTTKRD